MTRHRGGRKKVSHVSEDSSQDPEASEGLSLTSPALRFAPVSLFSVTVDAKRKLAAHKDVLNSAYELPNMGPLCGEDTFATVYLAWDNAGLWGAVQVEEPCERVSFPDVTLGDSIEIFVDTRDSKSSGFIHRFCHHFFFLPEPVEGHQAGEITRFRTEDAHELCDAKELKVSSKLQKSSYTLQWMIPAHCLHGYDPEQFDRLGFTYRINRHGAASQHFAVVASDFQLEQQPSLWASVRLIA